MAHRYTLSSRDGSLLWPRVPNGDAATVVALHAQSEQSQWLSESETEARQLVQLEALLTHCLATVPYYRDCLKGRITQGVRLDMDAWRALPILTRSALQQSGDEIFSESPPAAHGRISAKQSSGSTGKPVRIKTSAINNLFYYANNLRHYRWHDYDPAARYAGITRLTAMQRKLSATATPVPWMNGYVTGPFYYFEVGETASAQGAWLREMQPHLFTTYPSNLKNLAEEAVAGHIELPRLSAITTMSEVLDPETREFCEGVLEAPIHDIYSAQELGIVALQCPEAATYHTMAESVLVEILDEAGNPCAPGEVGRVIVTPLHNFVTPLIRYEVGDYAEVAAPCACGRGLPTINRIYGRVRNMLTLPGGQKVWPAFGSRGLTAIAPIRQHQIIQKSAGQLEARLVTERELTAEEETRLAQHITGRLPVVMSIAFTYLAEIPRNPGGKFEDFVSEIDNV